jgi:hypothetical protein
MSNHYRNDLRGEAMTLKYAMFGAASLLIASAGVAVAQDKPGGSGLQAASQNPIAALISVPFQSNWFLNTGPNEKTKYVMNFQPVIPVSLSDDWNLILRPIVPIINKPKLFPGDSSEFGLGDITPQILFSPAKPIDTAIGHMSWGAGPNLLLDTATDDSLGSGQWGAGPSAVVFFTNAPWTYGALVFNTWSFAGDNDREDVNLFALQPILNYNLSDGWSLVSAPVITANWEADSGDKWTVPLGGGVSKLFKVGGQHVQAQLASYYNVEKPEFGPDWQLQFQMKFLFPK